MTKKIFFSVFLVLIIVKFAVADPSISIKIPDPLGPVVSIKTLNENNKTIEERIYDSKGNLLRSTVFDEEGAVYEENEYAYNKNNTKSKHIFRDQAFTGALIIKYGENGEELEVTDSRQGNWIGNAPFRKWINKYNSNGIMTAQIGKFKNGDIFEKTSYVYKNNFLSEERMTKKGKAGQHLRKYERDPKGNAIKVTITNFDGTLDKVETFEYDAQGHKIEWVENAYYHGSPRGITIHRFDASGNKIARIYKSTLGAELEKRIYEYDDRGNLISEDMWGESGNHAGAFKYKYDDKGNLIWQGETNGNSPGSGVSYEYEYDKYGNWIKKAESDSGSIETRIIQYGK
ncbi:MAG: hypothetical protein HZC48_01115 [Nitrospirae bacterium]|nr:hypothetical protein [Nitrospirota bacterium]